ncbi:MAG: TPM domain-containing protein [Gemmobacter sp.]
MIRLFALLLWLPLVAQAEVFPEPASVFVTDLADVVDPETEDRLTAMLEAARRDPGTEIAVVTIRSRRDWGESASIEGFATGLFNAWGIGDATRNDGILILIAVADREARIALGAGYPPVFDGRAHRIIETEMLPAFREGRYGEGLVAGVQGVVDRIARPHRAGQIPTDSPAPEGGGFPWDLAAFGGFLALMASWAMRRQIGDQIARARRCPSCGRRWVQLARRTTRDPTETEPGEAVRELVCPDCDWRETRHYPIPDLATQRARSDTASSDGGFGGGRSSGGGATGRW